MTARLRSHFGHRLPRLVGMSLLLFGLGALPLLAQDDDEIAGSYTEVHHWIPAWTEVLPDGVRVRHAGYWLVTRNGTRPAEAPCEPCPSGPAPRTVVVETDPGAACVVAVDADAPVTVPCPAVAVEVEPRPCQRVVYVAPPVPYAPCAPRGFWRSVSWGWHDPSCFRGSIATPCEDREGSWQGGRGHGGGWSLPRLPFPPPAPWELLEHLHR